MRAVAIAPQSAQDVRNLVRLEEHVPLAEGAVDVARGIPHVVGGKVEERVQRGRGVPGSAKGILPFLHQLVQ